MDNKSVLIFAKTKYEKTPYDQWLAGTAIHPVILTSAEFAPSYRHMPEVYAFENYDQNQMIEKTAYEIARRQKPVAVFARAEADIIRAARLRERLGIEGQNLKSAMAFRHKVVMKDWLRNSGVTAPEYAVLDSAYTAIDFVEKHGFPIVIKPVSESGSLGTHIVQNTEELQRYFEHPAQWDMEIETFVEGQMYHVDGLIIDGDIRFITPFRYVNDCLSFREGRYLGHCTVGPEEPIYHELIAATRIVLETLPSPRNTAFHTELWVRPDGSIVFCEVASRTGGAMISSLVKHSFGIDLDQEWFMAECGYSQFPSTTNFRPGGAINIFPRRGTLLNLPEGEPDYVRERQFTGTIGKEYNGGVKSGLFLAGYVIAGDSTADVLANIAAMDEWTDRNFQWNLSGDGAV